jgi:flagellar assembly factor FliW
MPETETRNFGTISFSPESVFDFPNGLPGFEDRRRFVPVQDPRTAPIVFLQSLDDPSLCFTSLPIWVIDPDYTLRILEPDLETMHFPPDYQPRIGADVLCLALLSIRQTGTTANLLAPVVVNLKNYKAVQAVSTERNYSHRHLLFAREEPGC